MTMAVLEQNHSDLGKRAKSTSRRDWREEMVTKVADSSWGLGYLRDDWKDKGIHGKTRSTVSWQRDVCSKVWRGERWSTSEEQMLGGLQHSEPGRAWPEDLCKILEVICLRGVGVGIWSQSAMAEPGSSPRAVCICQRPPWLRGRESSVETE